ncbi:MAG TPA: hypothetical protein VKY22_22835 [Bradyrhizobium sp.]|nr:hypothetical protein [Bradyrhizobium sp.]
MNSSPSPAAAEPNNVAAASADERLKQAYQQIASADEQLARVTETLSKLEGGAAHRDAAPRTMPIAGRRPSRAGPAIRALVGLLLAACIAGGAFISQSASGDATRRMIARWISPVLPTSLPLARGGPGAPPGPVLVAATDTADVPASSPASTPAPQDAAPAPAPLSPELAQQLQTITNQIANLDQKLEQLKAAQDQMVIQMTSNSARAIGEFKAGQEQILRLMAKAPEPNVRPKTSAATSSVAPSATSSVSPARPVAARDRQPASAHGSPQARSSPARSSSQQQ